MLGLLLAMALETWISHLISPPIIRAALHEKRIYTSGAIGVESNTKWTFGGGTLSLLRTPLEAGSEMMSFNMYVISNRRNALLRWQLINNRYYCVAYWTEDAVHRAGYVKVATITEIEEANANSRDTDFLDRRKRFEKLIEVGRHLNPVGQAVGLKEPSITSLVFFDFWCRGDEGYEVYLTEPHEGNRLTRHDFHAERVRGERPDLQWDNVGEWKFDWTGPFYVAASGDERYFVTDTGRVFIAPRKAKPGTALKELWKGPPVHALVHDSDAKTWFAFAKDQFFEIADPIKPKPHTIAIRRAWTADEAVDTAAKCGRVIRNLPAPALTERTWDDLALPEPRVGNNAVWAMTNEPARAIALLKVRLKPVAVPPAKEIAALIAGLGAEVFADREAAQRRLREFGRTIEPIVRDATSTTSNTEVRRRLKQLLADPRTPDEVRAGRAVRVLERIDTPDARRLLQEWAEGAEAAVLTREARKTLHP